jgi:hypothetical protein
MQKAEKTKIGIKKRFAKMFCVLFFIVVLLIQQSLHGSRLFENEMVD